MYRPPLGLVSGSLNGYDWTSEPSNDIDFLPDGWSAVGLVRALPPAPADSVGGSGPKVKCPWSQRVRPRSFPTAIASNDVTLFEEVIVDPRTLTPTQDGVRLETLIYFLQRGSLQTFDIRNCTPCGGGDVVYDPPPRLYRADDGAILIYDGHHRMAAGVWGGCRKATAWLWKASIAIE